MSQGTMFGMLVATVVALAAIASVGAMVGILAAVGLTLLISACAIAGILGFLFSQP